MRPSNKCREHRVPFDVGANAIEFVFIAHPMVVGLVLPERAGGAPKNPIGLPCS